jgi:hypothetical protein
MLCCLRSSTDFSPQDWNEKHGWTCELNHQAGEQPCDPIPVDQPYDVDCRCVCCMCGPCSSLGVYRNCDGDSGVCGLTCRVRVCSWIQDRLLRVGGTGFADGVGVSEGEQYLTAFAYGLTLLISGEMAGDETV